MPNLRKSFTKGRMSPKNAWRMTPIAPDLRTTLISVPYFGLFRYPVFLTTQHSGHSLPLHPLHQAAALVVAALLYVAALFTATFRLHARLRWALSNGLKRNPYPGWLDAESWLVYTCNYIHRHSLLNATWYDRIWHDMTWHDIMWYDVMWCDMNSWRNFACSIMLGRLDIMRRMRWAG